MSTIVHPLGHVALPELGGKSPKHDVHKYRDIAKLNEDNWVNWKFSIMGALQERGLWDMVQGRILPIEPVLGIEGRTTNQPSINQWIDMDCSARTQIIQNLSPSIQILVFDCTLASSTWAVLLEEFESRNLDRCAAFRKQYDNEAYIDGTSLREHLTKLDYLRGRLALMGDSINDKTHALRMIRYLPVSYDGISQVIRALSLNAKETREKLLAEEIHRRVMIGDGYTPLPGNLQTVSALTASSGSQNNADTQLHAMISNSIATLERQGARIPNSLRNYVKNPNQPDRKKKQLRNPQLTCSNPKCGKSGHLIENCWSEGGGKEGKGPKQKNANADSKDTATGSGDKASNRVMMASTIGSIIPNPRSGSSHWILDSGASVNIANTMQGFTTFRKLLPPIEISTANHGVFYATGEGSVCTSFKGTNDEYHPVTLPHVLYAPSCAENLLSISVLDDKHFDIHFLNKKCVISKCNSIYAIGERYGSLYALKELPRQQCLIATSSNNTSNDEFMLIHRRMGHVGFDTVRKLISDGSIILSKNQVLPDSNPDCPNCPFGKMKQSPYPARDQRIESFNVLELTSSDLCGPFPPSLGGKTYFGIFYDRGSRHVYPYFLSKKDQATLQWQLYVPWAERMTGNRIKTLFTDGGGEFCNKKMDEFNSIQGIEHLTSAPYAHSSNGSAERIIGVIQELALALLHDAGLSIRFWTDAVKWAVQIWNRVPHAATGLIPLKVFMNKDPNYKNFRLFGSKAIIHVPKETRRKGGFRAIEGKLVGVYDDSYVWKLWLPDYHRFVKSRNVKFIESSSTVTTEQDKTPDEYNDEPIYNRADSPTLPAESVFTPQPDITAIPNEIEYPPLPPDSPLTELDVLERDPTFASGEVVGGMSSTNSGDNINDPLRDKSGWKIRTEEVANHPDQAKLGRNQRIRKQTPQYSAQNPQHSAHLAMDKINKSIIGNNGRSPSPFARQGLPYAAYLGAVDPEDVIQIEIESARAEMTERELWAAADLKEWQRMFLMKVLRIVNRVDENGVIRRTYIAHLIHRTKLDKHGNIKEHKSRLCGDGRYEERGIDYLEVFVNNPQGPSMYVVLAIALRHGFQLRQVDVIGAFLNTSIPKGKEMYIEIPRQFKHLYPSNSIAALDKFLYGFHEAPLFFNALLHEKLTARGWIASDFDPCLYFRWRESDGGFEMSLWHTDDGLLVAEGPDERIEETIAEFAEDFPIDDMGRPARYLGCNFDFNEDSNTIHVSQIPAIDKLISDLNLEDKDSRSTPMSTNQDFTVGEVLSAERATHFRSIIGQLMWIAKRTRPDICYAVCVLARHNQSPTITAFNAAIRIVKYLKGTRTHGVVVGLCFTELGHCHQPFINYVDAAWGDDLPTSRSTGGNLSTLWGTPIDWASKVQSEVTGSTFHAELVQFDIGVKAALWQRKLTEQLSFADSREQHATPILTDNTSVISFAHNTVSSKRVRHINTKYNVVRDHIANGDVYVRHIDSKNNLADILTKPLALEPHSRLTRAMNVMSLADHFMIGTLVLDEHQHIPGTITNLKLPSQAMDGLCPQPRANLTFFDSFDHFSESNSPDSSISNFDIDADDRHSPALQYPDTPVASTSYLASTSGSADNGYIAVYEDDPIDMDLSWSD